MGPGCNTLHRSNEASRVLFSYVKQGDYNNNNRPCPQLRIAVSVDAKVSSMCPCQLTQIIDAEKVMKSEMTTRGLLR